MWQAWVKYMTIVFNYNYKYLEKVQIQLQIHACHNYKYMHATHAMTTCMYCHAIHAIHTCMPYSAIFKMAAVDSLDCQVLYHCKIN